MTSARHAPVLLAEVRAALRGDGATLAGKRVIDGTFGAGGYSRAFLVDGAACVTAIDRDPSVRRFADALTREHPDTFRLVEGAFGEMEDLIAERDWDGVALDIGVSSMQLDEATRGFSFRHDAPLDMRMGASGPTAADLVNTLDETALADIIYRYGEERRSRRVARAIVEARAEAPIETTGALAALIRSVVPAARDGIDPATRSFQSLRIAVNDELGELRRGLHAAERLLKPGGRLAVVSFHSLEDRIVKDFLKTRSGKGESVSRHLPAAPEPARKPSFTLIGPQPIKPSKDEIARNPRARSARLRTAARTSAPAWPPFEKEAA